MKLLSYLPIMLLMTMITAYNGNQTAAFSATDHTIAEQAAPAHLTEAVHELIPEGWAILDSWAPASAAGDLNQDGIDDIALVIEQVESDTEEAPARSLLIAFGTESGEYTISVIADNVVLRADEGGVFGDPFSGIFIEDDAVIVSDYGGSNWRWYNTYRFAFLDDDWYLIGYTSGSDFINDDIEAEEEDHDLLTGDYVIQYIGDDGEMVTEKGNLGYRELVAIRDFNMFALADPHMEDLLNYRNQSLGFTLTFPESWYTYYNIYEWDDGIDVYFIGNSLASWNIDDDHPVVGLYLFSIAAESFVEEAGESLDNITEIGQANGATYYYFTATDCTICVLGADDPELDKEELALMKSDCAKVSTMREEIGILLNSFQNLKPS